MNPRGRHARKPTICEAVHTPVVSATESEQPSSTRCAGRWTSTSSSSGHGRRQRRRSRSASSASSVTMSATFLISLTCPTPWPA